jgi:hypothetical protein
MTFAVKSRNNSDHCVFLDSKYVTGSLLLVRLKESEEAGDRNRWMKIEDCRRCRLGKLSEGSLGSIDD